MDESQNERFKPNLALMASICETPKNWSKDEDEELAELLKDIVNTDMPGSIRNLIKSVSVSTQRVIFRWILIFDLNIKLFKTKYALVN